MRRSRVVYFVQAGKAGPIKIGSSCDVERRLKSMQSHNHRKLRLIGQFKSVGYFSERDTHRRFAAARIRGEWFRPSDEMHEFINAISVAIMDDGVSPCEWMESYDARKAAAK
jgi:hypothetical protein